ncbi:MAG: MerR family transcriptional regulator, partial [Ilumatobacteraceae bacterium]
MAELTDDDFLSIGEVLGLLLEEFPDVTISKIRFLESQGLIDPERTPSGYRKFYDTDVERLRVILREQRENYLPLRVIKDRIETGVIDPSGDLPRPDQDHDDHDDHTGPTEVPPASLASHPAGANGA